MDSGEWIASEFSTPNIHSKLRTSRHYPRAIAMLIGTIIGVGIFGVPYVIAQSGIAIGLAHFAVLACVVLLVHLAYGELVLRTSATHRLVGYAGMYLGRSGRTLTAISTVLGMYGALLAYLIVGGQFLSDIVAPFASLSPRAGGIIVGILGAFAIGGGLRLIEELEFLLTAFLFLAMALIIIVGVQRVNPEFLRTVDASRALLPYGAVLFSLGGVSAITELRTILRGNERLLARAITWGTLIAATLTALFAVVVVGVSGPATSAEAIAGLAPILGRSIVILGAVLGFLAIATSLLSLGIYLSEVFRYDFRKSRISALAWSMGIPFAVFLLGSPSFTEVILITGALFGGLDGILVIACALRARTLGDRQPEFTLRIPAWVHGIVLAMFAAGMVTTLAEIIRERLG